LEAVALTDRGAAQVRAGRPWIWRTEVARAPAHLPPGPVRVTDRRARVLGGALWATRSPIALRMVQAGADAPPWDRALLASRLQAALARRRQLYGPAADAYRVVHAEADQIPGLLVDRYADLAVVQIGCEALDQDESGVLSCVRELLAPRALVLRNDGSLRDFESLPRSPPRLVHGDSARAHFHEGAIGFEIDALADAKTGAFLDQRENHLHVASYARGVGRALDLFTYQGGFALQLAHAGVEEVLAVDESAAAATRARENAERAGLAGRIKVRTGNAWEELRRLEAAGERFDLVVLDPPALAKRRGPLAAATRAYRELNQRALRLLRSEGILVTCSCSARLQRDAFGALLAQAAAAAPAALQILEQRGAGRDHPELAGAPETAYLKCWICRALKA